jgi:hypothetical protein
MYIHIGDNVILKTGEIIGFFDIETLKENQSDLRNINMLKNQPPEVKTLILTEKNGKSEEIFSIISTRTLRSRLKKCEKNSD